MILTQIPLLSISLCCARPLLLSSTGQTATWQFTASFVGVSFPKGQRLVSRDTPGVTKASMVVTLADVGAGMEAPVTYLQRFVSSKEQGGIVADRWASSRPGCALP